MAMKVLVQDGETGLFLKSDKHWTRKAREARDFHSCSHALEELFHMELEKPDIILSFGDPQWDIKLPVGGKHALRAAA
jgi:hypothetical protein